MTAPRVSIVTATYNRGNVLRFTIEAVRAQTFTDWEMLVIGDACTDDTEQVVQSFGDPRIRFVNLPENAGEQSVPNNEGIRRARGEYVALLNHDDLWTRDHLQTCLGAIGDADFVSTALILIYGGRPHLEGVCPNGRYEPQVIIPASAWLMRRELAVALPWRRAREIWLMPSQEWLFRASRRGARMRGVAKATVLALPSAARARSYSDRPEAEHAHYAELLRTDPDLIPRLLAQVALDSIAERNGATATAMFARGLRILARHALLAFGVHPHVPQYLLRYRRKGGIVETAHKLRGLPPLPKRRTT
jgi:glycosyltransferase involved in cell wall biosynthesis